MEELKLMRHADLDLENQDDRRKFLGYLYPLIENWNGEIPNLRWMFKSKDINRLLMEDVSCENKKASFVDFAIKAGYKDKPEWPSPMRTTAIHLVASQTKPDMALIRKLFDIYDRYDYVDEKTGLTHLHVACMSAELTHVAARFLGLGRSDPNCRVRVTGDTPLHYAARHRNFKVVNLLLRHGANPTLANDDGLIPLHLFCQVDKKMPLPYFDRCNIEGNEGNTLPYLALRSGNMRAVELMLAKATHSLLRNDEDLTSLRMAVGLGGRDFAQMFYGICGEQDRIDYPNLVNNIKNMNINNNNNNNEKEDILPKTDKENRKRLESLHVAIVSHDMILVDRLVKEGRNPNARDSLGRTPLHVICQADSSLIGESLARLFFETCDEVKQRLEIDARDAGGLTPLQWAVARLLPETVELLLERGADLAKFVFPPRDAFLRNEVYSGDLEAMTEIAACAADICDSLERRGYKMKDPEVVFLMERLEEYGLFAEADSLDESEEYRSHEARLRRLFWPCVLQPYMKKKNYRVPIDRTCGELEATRCADLWNIFREAQ